MSMSNEDRVEARFQHRKYILDIAGLTAEQRGRGSIVLGGSGREFVVPGDDFNYDQIDTVLFHWGDHQAEALFAAMLEHEDTPSPDFLPFCASTVLGNLVWSLAVQIKDFDPSLAYPSDRPYRVLPFDQDAGLAAYREHQALPLPRPELLGKVGTRWVQFKLGTSIGIDSDNQSV